MHVDDFLKELDAALGSQYILRDDQDKVPYLTDWRGLYTGVALAVVLPKDTAQVVAIVKICQQYQVAIVPQGGNTSLTGSATPEASGLQIVLSLKRMNAIRHLDLQNQTITVEAGCILQVVQEEVKKHDAFFPLSLAAQGSCTIGGNLATNAGGTNVLRFGNARDLCLGLEVVTPQGEVLNGLRGLRKDNTGYDLRNLYIGSEGTLGIITAAVMKLYPAPTNHCAALVAIADFPMMMGLFHFLQKRASAELTAFEMMTREAIDLTIQHFPQFDTPIVHQAPFTILIELFEYQEEKLPTTSSMLEGLLEQAMQHGFVVDAVLANNLSQVKAFWQIREHITMAQAKEPENLKFDIAFPLSNLSGFITETDQMLRQAFPGIQIINFGHLGDGNLHYNLCAPREAVPCYLAKHESWIQSMVYQQITRFAGSISAEHGIGQLKREHLKEHRGDASYKVMQTIKRALDPENLFNPNKVLIRKDL
jgi:FAD/FMN-containing dehydrogenase